MPFLRKILSLLLIQSLLFTQILPLFTADVWAQNSGFLLNLPTPGTLVKPSDSFVPLIMKGIKIFPDNPLRFDFVMDTGSEDLSSDDLQQSATQLIKYFLTSLTIPEDELWVNLSPYEKDRVVPEAFGITEMGRDLLGQDYLLKQLTASLMYPEDPLGGQFWERVYQKAYQLYGTTDIPVDTFNKVWIVPEAAEIFENGDIAFLVDSRLKVMLEQDYLALKENDIPSQDAATQSTQMSELSSALVREVIIPELEREVNEGRHFAQLRQIYNSLVMATWFKENLRQSILSKVYVGENKTRGVEVEDKAIKEKIYQQYLEAFEKGAYNIIKEDVSPGTEEVVLRKYFSGGFKLDPRAVMNTQEVGLGAISSAVLPETKGRLLTAFSGMDPYNKGMASSGISKLNEILEDLKNQPTQEEEKKLLDSLLKQLQEQDFLDSERTYDGNVVVVGFKEDLINNSVTQTNEQKLFTDTFTEWFTSKSGGYSFISYNSDDGNTKIVGFTEDLTDRVVNFQREIIGYMRKGKSWMEAFVSVNANTDVQDDVAVEYTAEDLINREMNSHQGGIVVKNKNQWPEFKKGISITWGEGLSGFQAEEWDSSEGSVEILNIKIDGNPISKIYFGDGMDMLDGSDATLMGEKRLNDNIILEQDEILDILEHKDRSGVERYVLLVGNKMFSVNNHGGEVFLIETDSGLTKQEYKSIKRIANTQDRFAVVAARGSKFETSILELSNNSDVSEDLVSGEVVTIKRNQEFLHKHWMRRSQMDPHHQIHVDNWLKSSFGEDRFAEEDDEELIRGLIHLVGFENSDGKAEVENLDQLVRLFLHARVFVERIQKNVNPFDDTYVYGYAETQVLLNLSEKITIFLRDNIGKEQVKFSGLGSISLEQEDGGALSEEIRDFARLDLDYQLLKVPTSEQEQMHRYWQKRVGEKEIHRNNIENLNDFERGAVLSVSNLLRILIHFTEFRNGKLEDASQLDSLFHATQSLIDRISIQVIENGDTYSYSEFEKVSLEKIQRQLESLLKFLKSPLAKPKHQLIVRANKSPILVSDVTSRSSKASSAIAIPIVENKISLLEELKENLIKDDFDLLTSRLDKFLFFWRKFKESFFKN